MPDFWQNHRATEFTSLSIFVQDKIKDRIVGHVVGAPLAVPVAEELFASG